tara:strand:+ start:3409 stop:4041 length:633 start_codon:yes stop_codon:yes gene_type:complete
MRYQGNIIQNLDAAAKSRDKALLKDLILDKLSELIQTNPKAIIKALRLSNVKVSNNDSKEELINKSVDNLYSNRLFQKNIAVTFVANGIADNSAYANSTGQGFDLSALLGGGGGGGGAAAASSGGEAASSGGGGGAAGIISAVSGMVGSISQWGASKNQLKAEEAKSKGLMYEKIFGARQNKKTNWLPIVAIAGVLLIGGIVVYRVTAKS